MTIHPRIFTKVGAAFQKKVNMLEEQRVARNETFRMLVANGPALVPSDLRLLLDEDPARVICPKAG